MNHPVALCKVFDNYSFKFIGQSCTAKCLTRIFVAPQTVITHNTKSCFCLAVSDSNRNKHSFF